MILPELSINVLVPSWMSSARKRFLDSILDHQHVAVFEHCDMVIYDRVGEAEILGEEAILPVV